MTSTLKISAFVVMATFAIPAQAQLKSVEDALALSKRTGRPIFAVAGKET